LITCPSFILAVSTLDAVSSCCHPKEEHMRNSTRVAITAVGALVLTGAFASPAFATVDNTTGDTSATVTVTGGGLSISVPSSTYFDAVAPIQSYDDANLAKSYAQVQNTAVTDTRAGTEGWEVTYSVTPFVNAITKEELPAEKIFVNPGGNNGPTGTVTAQAGLPTTGATGPIYSGTNVHGNNSVGWSTSITVTIPADALAGDYAGTFTQSITTAG
jgi:hypothetical protein